MLKTSPTTKVMKGAMPPAMIEKKTAGSTNTRRSRRKSREKRSRKLGAGGVYSVCGVVT